MQDSTTMQAWIAFYHTGILFYLYYCTVVVKISLLVTGIVEQTQTGELPVLVLQFTGAVVLHVLQYYPIQQGTFVEM